MDVFSLFTLDEYRQANEARWDKAGHQKQYRVEQMDLDILERAKQKVGSAARRVAASLVDVPACSASIGSRRQESAC